MDYAGLIKKKNNYAIILIAGTVVVGLLVAGLGVYPLYQTAAATTKQADQKSAELKALQDPKAILDGMKNKEEELQKSAELVASALPEQKDVGGLFIQVNALADKNGGTVHSMSGSGVVAANAQTTNTGFSGIQKYAYSVPISFGNYSSFKSFISESKNALRLLNITDVALSANETGSIEAVLNITTYARN